MSEWVTEWKLLSHVWLFTTPWTVPRQAPPSMEFSRQVYWSGLPFPSPGDLPDSGIEPRSPESLHLSHQGSLKKRVTVFFIAFFLHVYILAFLSTINKDLFLKTRINESKFFQIFFPNKNEYLFLWPLLVKYIWRLLQITQRYGDNAGVFAEDSFTLWPLFSYNY